MNRKKVISLILAGAMVATSSSVLGISNNNQTMNSHNKILLSSNNANAVASSTATSNNGNAIASSTANANGGNATASSTANANGGKQNPIINHGKLQPNVPANPVINHGELQPNVPGKPVTNHGELQPNVPANPAINHGELQPNVPGKPVTNHGELQPNVPANPVINHGELQPNVPGKPVTNHGELQPNVPANPVINHGELQPNVPGKPVTNHGELQPNTTPKPVVQKQGKIKFTFISVETGKPMANTVIDINGSSFTTNSKGQLQAIPLQPVSQTLKISSKGFQAKDVNVDVKNNTTVNETVKLAPITSNELVTILNKETGKPVVNTNVTIGGVQLKTNAQGQVTLSNLWAGNQSFNVAIDGFNNATLNFKSVAGQTGKTTLEVTPVKEAAQQGKVVFTFVSVETGKPMANTVIDINGSSFTTNSKGQLQAIPLQPVAQTLKVSSKGFQAQDVNVNVKNNSTIKETVNLAPLACNEVVTILNNETGKPVVNTNVNIGGIQLKTNEQGQVTLGNLWAGNQSFNVSIDGFNSTTLNFQAIAGQTGNTTIKVSPQTSRAMVKFVNKDTNKAITNTTFNVSGTKVTTNSSGIAILRRLSSGQQTLTISSNDYKTSNQTVEVSSNQTTHTTFSISKNN